MGEYQRKNIENETSKSINDIEHNVLKTIGNVLDEVLTLKDQIIALPSSNDNSKQ